MVIFGVRVVCALRNLKCSIIGWPEKPILPVTLTPSLRVVTAANAMPVSMTWLLDAVEAPQEIEMPPRAAEFAVGDRLQADLFLLLDDVLDLAVFDRLQLGGAVISPLARRSRACFQRGGPQQAADMIGAERRSWFVACVHSSNYPHTSSAISTIMRSFAHSSSSASTLPSSVEAKPHCGDRQS